MDAADTRRLTIGTDVIQPVQMGGVVIRDLGVYLDSHLTMKAHVTRVARTCFYHLRRLRSIRRGLRHGVTARLISALVISRLHGLLQLSIGTFTGFNVGTAPESSMLLLGWSWIWDHLIT